MFMNTYDEQGRQQLTSISMKLLKAAGGADV